MAHLMVAPGDVPPAPSRVGRYRVLGRLAAGGMAEILLAAQDGVSGFTRPVVVKRVLPHLARKSEFRKMFVDEARILATLRHPNVVTVQELGEDDHVPFLVMEYLEGESLDAVLRAERALGGQLDRALAAHVIAEACAGLHAAHEHRDLAGEPLEIVHRDVSPQNLFVGYDGSVKVIDFGIAKAAKRETKTETGTVKGKFAYMSPEQIDGSGVDRRTDVFALGVVLHELLTGRRLFARTHQLEIVRAICLAPNPRPIDFVADVPPVLDAITMRALEKDRSNRFPTALAMRRELLGAIRELDARDDLREALASRMQELFAARRSEKSELMRRVRDGEKLVFVAADRDDEHEGDAFEVVLSVMAATPHPSATIPDVRRSGSGVPRIAAAVGIALVAVLAAVAALASSSQPAPHVAAAPAPEPRAPVDPAPIPVAVPGPTAPEAPVAPAQVRVHLVTTPAGAHVEIGGEPRGTTPLELELPRSDVPLDVVVRADGWREQRASVVPTVDQRIELALRRERRPVRPAAIRPTRADDPFARVD